VIGTLVGSVTLLLYGIIEIGTIVVATARAGTVSAEGAKKLAFGFIEATDSFLISIVLFMIAQGLFALFVDDTLPLPPWLEIHNLDDLKAKRISVVITVLAVLFLGELVKWDGFDLLPLAEDVQEGLNQPPRKPVVYGVARSMPGVGGGALDAVRNARPSGRRRRSAGRSRVK
jgi:uncharacterized membrane protein YqhA